MEGNLQSSGLARRPIVDSRLKEESGTGQVDFQMGQDSGSLHRRECFRAEVEGHRPACPVKRRAVAVVGQQANLNLAGVPAASGIDQFNV